ncbi:hypothetical protein BGX24_011907 [Mortierella sp. AD032]|nr:hypothetical protein BGX24_011907 [Mortierella sp. AD032]
MSFDPVHLNWMVASGHSSKYREERRNIAAGWHDQIMVERRHEDRRMERAQSGRGGESLNKMDEGVEEQLTRDLQHLGLVLDVKEVLDEMDEKGYRCWPVLQCVSVFNDRGVGLRPADELMRLFPPKSSKLYR